MAAKMGGKRKRRIWAAIEAEGRDKVCAYCGTEVHRGLPPAHPNAANLDHAIPRSRGGTNELSNLVVACFSCNQNRGCAAHPTIVVRDKTRGWSPFWDLKRMMKASQPASDML